MKEREMENQEAVQEEPDRPVGYSLPVGHPYYGILNASRIVARVEGSMFLQEYIGREFPEDSTLRLFELESHKHVEDYWFDDPCLEADIVIPLENFEDAEPAAGKLIVKDINGRDVLFYLDPDTVRDLPTVGDPDRNQAVLDEFAYTILTDQAGITLAAHELLCGLYKALGLIAPADVQKPDKVLRYSSGIRVATTKKH
jgi:hypothetical protein